MHLDCKVQIATLIADKTPIIISAKYFNFANVFFKKSIAVLLKHTKIKIHTIDLKKSKQPPYKPIYSLRSVELKILKTYI